MDDIKQDNEADTDGTSVRSMQAAVSSAKTTGERHVDDTPDDADDSGSSTQRQTSEENDCVVRGADAVNTADDDASNAERYAEYSKHANMRAFIRILLLGFIAIVVVFAVAFAADNIGGGNTNGTQSGNSGTSSTTGNETVDTQGTNAIVTTTDGTCSDSGNENTNGCDGKSDGTHGYEGLSGRQASLLEEVGTDTVLQGIKQGRTFVALFGYASCSDCKAAVPLLLDTAIDAGINQVLYVDTRANPAWKSNTDIDGYNELVSVMGDRFTTDDDGKPHMQVPFVVFVRNGTIVASVEGDDGLSKADSIQADATGQELIGKYDAGFKAMLGN